MDSVSGVGVVDKAFVVLNVLVTRPLALAEVVEATGIPRATCHRLLSALEHHGAVRRNDEGLYCVGPSMAGMKPPHPAEHNPLQGFPEPTQL